VQTPSTDQMTEQASEPTLEAVLSQSVRAEVPDRLAMLLQLAWPLAAHLASLGWWRAATGAVAVASFGAWGYFERRLRAAEPDDVGMGNPRVLHALRAASGGVAGVATAVLVMRLFFWLLGDAPGH
jgi:hypothetical protein